MNEIKLNLGCGQHPLEGFVNMDPEIDGWKFESGLRGYPDESVDAITISHALMYVHERDFGFVFDEVWRVLKYGGIVRITEDDSRFWKWHGTITELTPIFMEAVLKVSEFEPYHLDKDSTLYHDRSLIQDWHPRAVSFYIEGKKI